MDLCSILSSAWSVLAGAIPLAGAFLLHRKVPLFLMGISKTALEL